MKPAKARKTKSVGGGEYTVQPGDSLSVIARRCHVTQAELVEVNKLADPNKIRIGQKLILPATGQLPTAMPRRAVKGKAKSKSVKSVTVLPDGGEYVVKPGDNLSKIAARHGVKTSALREASKLQSDRLKIGQKLMIPAARKAVPAEAAAPAVLPVPVPPAVGRESKAVEPAAVEEVMLLEVAVAAPAAEGTELAPAGYSTDKPSSIASSGIVHTVQVNEDLSNIATLYAVTVEEIAELNQLSTNRTVNVGQRLKIP